MYRPLRTVSINGCTGTTSYLPGTYWFPILLKGCRTVNSPRVQWFSFEHKGGIVRVFSDPRLELTNNILLKSLGQVSRMFS
ncbi:uncharacterized protein YALI1_B25387g [Yarrowia lipolytica]|uniref:Uncharacterized protein n=1 Tax=Yarrowia lipolytica TaxID=4952 RepID=A0A1D8N8H2_YARLL|nr:hypothetical protein YALI1_B25387g [Yarrowia lipolytica]